ncbi:MAG: hypothetical protein OXC98_03040 [bacterium]|nr:hypothetical protein [bacterium]
MSCSTLVWTETVEVPQRRRRQHRADIPVVLAWYQKGPYRRLGAHRVCRPVAHRSKSRSVTMIPNGSWRVRLTRIADPPPRVYRLRRRGSALVCRDPLIAARSGRVTAANAWKVMFDVPEIRIASGAR